MINRIKRFIEIQNLTSSNFANEIGVQRSSVSHVLSGRNKPSLDFITKIKERFPEINLEWLIIGKGSMISVKEKIEGENRNDSLEIKLDDNKSFGNDKGSLETKFVNESLSNDIIKEESLVSYGNKKGKKTKKLYCFIRIIVLKSLIHKKSHLV